MSTHPRPVDLVSVTVTFHNALLGGPPQLVELAVKETHLISEIKYQALTELGFNTTAKRKDGEWILRVERFVLDETKTLQEVMRDVIGHATVEAMLARVGTIPMRLEFQRTSPIVIATH